MHTLINNIGAFAVAAMLVVGSAFARDATHDDDYGRDDMGAVTSPQHEDQASVIRASDLIGYTVRNEQGENLGEITDLAINPDDGSLAYVALSYGGFLGMGENLIAVPVDRLDFRPDENAAILDVDRQTLENMEGFDDDNWPAEANPQLKQDREADDFDHQHQQPNGTGDDVR